MNKRQLLEKYKGERFFKEVYVDGMYAPVLLEKLDVVLDVGALAGEFSTWIHNRAGVVYAFEPQPEAFKELEENIEDFPKVKAFKLAIGGENGTKKLYKDTRGGHSLLGQKDDFEEVECKTLATVMKENNIDQVDVLKIDVENGEMEVFSAPDFAEIASKINFIIGEHMNGVVESLLEQNGYTIEKYDHGAIARRQ